MSSTRDEFGGLYSLYAPIGIAVAVLVLGLIVFVVLRYRYRPGREPSKRSSMPVVEVAIAIVIAGIVALLVTRTFQTEAEVDSVAQSNVQINVTAFQWGWRFDYPGQHVTITGNSNQPPTMAVPVGVPVDFTMTSRDVIHAFWIPEQRFKRDAFPDRSSEFTLEFDSPGMNGGRCAEFCGLRHDAMLFNVLALDQGDYRDWLADRAKGAA